MKIVKVFGGKKVTIRTLEKKDLRNVKKFQDCINSLVEEDAQILVNKKFSLKEEKEWMKRQLANIKSKKTVSLFAEDNNIIIGSCSIDLMPWRQCHVGSFGIIIRKGYRGIGLGNYLMCEVIKIAKKELKPKPKILELCVFPTNIPALNLYKKHGFKEVARIPKDLNYKGKLIDSVVMIRK